MGFNLSGYPFCLSAQGRVTESAEATVTQASLATTVATAVATIMVIGPDVGVGRRLATQANALLCVGFDDAVVLQRRLGLG